MIWLWTIRHIQLADHVICLVIQWRRCRRAVGPTWVASAAVRSQAPTSPSTTTTTWRARARSTSARWPPRRGSRRPRSASSSVGSVSRTRRRSARSTTRNSAAGWGLSAARRGSSTAVTDCGSMEWRSVTIQCPTSGLAVCAVRIYLLYLLYFYHIE